MKVFIKLYVYIKEMRIYRAAQWIPWETTRKVTIYLLTYLLHGAESFLRSLLVLQLVKKFPAFLEPECSSQYSQVPATCPYPEPTPSGPHNALPLPEDPS